MNSRLSTEVRRGRTRLAIVLLLSSLVFLVLLVRLVDLTYLAQLRETEAAIPSSSTRTPMRGAIMDRNGLLLAVTLELPSVYADPSRIRNPKEAAIKLAPILKMERRELEERLSRSTRFVWLKRHVSPRIQQQILRTGIPGVDFIDERKRIYPQGTIGAHAIGFTDRDGKGLAGLERSFNDHLAAGDQLSTTVDLRLQYSARRHLAEAIERFSAIGGTAIIMDASDGSIPAMVSLPDFDPQDAGTASDDERFNRATLGVYETGSTFKILTTAMVLEDGLVTSGSIFDASKPLRIGRFTISDYRGENRPLTVEEILVHSSNIGTAKMALELGAERQEAWIRKLGLDELSPIEIMEKGQPLLPGTWRSVNTATISYGHGIAISPLHLMSAVASTINGGFAVSPTLLPTSGPVDDPHASALDHAPKRVFSEETSQEMRRLLRKVTTEGTGGSADVPGYQVGGKTGTAEKIVNGRYVQGARISSFLAAFPMDAPRYLVYVMLDEPKGIPETYGFATGGWVAAPVAGKIIEDIVRLEGIPAT